MANILGLIDLLELPENSGEFQKILLQGIIDSAKELDAEMHSINHVLQDNDKNE